MQSPGGLDSARITTWISLQCCTTVSQLPEVYIQNCVIDAAQWTLAKATMHLEGKGAAAALAKPGQLILPAPLASDSVLPQPIGSAPELPRSLRPLAGTPV